jgi:hypothetical protein
MGHLNNVRYRELRWSRNAKPETQHQRRINLRINPPTVDIPITCVNPR